MESLASLYVGDLPPEVTEKDLEDSFSPFGPLHSARLFRSFNNSSAHINYSSPSHAYKALECVNNIKIKGIPLMMLRDQNEASKLFLKDLDPSVSTADLHVLFSIFGALISCKVQSGFGFVQFASQDSAISALNSLSGTVFRGKTLCISAYEFKDERQDNCVVSEFTNLYVKNLPEDLNEETLKKIFSECGKVFNVAIMKDQEGKSKGFGFVNFESHNDAVKAIQKLDGSSLGGKKLYVGRAMKKSEREELLKHGGDKHLSGGINLYVKNLDASIDDSKLKEIFRSFGRVNSVKVMRDDRGVSKGFGFVSFGEEEAGKIAMRFVNGSFVKGKFVYVGVAQRKEARQKELQSIFSSSNTFDMFQHYTNIAKHHPNYSDPFTYHQHDVYPCVPVRWSEQIPFQASENIPVWNSRPIPVKVSEKIPVRMSEQIPAKASDRIPVRMSEQIPVKASDKIPVRMSEQIPVKASEKIPAKAVTMQMQRPTTRSGSNVARVYEQKQVQPFSGHTNTTRQKQIWCKMQSNAKNTMTETGPSTATAAAESVGNGNGMSKEKTGILLEMEKSKMQKILNNPHCLAIHILKATASAQLGKSPHSKSHQHYPINSSSCSTQA